MTETDPDAVRLTGRDIRVGTTTVTLVSIKQLELRTDANPFGLGTVLLGVVVSAAVGYAMRAVENWGLLVASLAAIIVVGVSAWWKTRHRVFRLVLVTDDREVSVLASRDQARVIALRDKLERAVTLAWSNV